MTLIDSFQIHVVIGVLVCVLHMGICPRQWRRNLMQEGVPVWLYVPMFLMLMVLLWPAVLLDIIRNWGRGE